MKLFSLLEKLNTNFISISLFTYTNEQLNENDDDNASEGTDENSQLLDEMSQTLEKLLRENASISNEV